MNEEALNVLYGLAQQDGYEKSYEDFVVLMSENEDAVNQMYSLAKDDGYTKEMSDFQTLVGFDNVKKKEDQQPLVSDGPEVAEDILSVTEEQTITPPSDTLTSDDTTTGAIEPVDVEEAEDILSVTEEQPITPTSDTLTSVEDVVEIEMPEESQEELTAIERQFGKNVITDFFGDMYRAGVQGQTQGQSLDEALTIFGSGAEATDEEIQAFIQANEALANAPVSDEMKSFQKIYEENDRGILGFILGVAENPTVLPQLFVSSTSALLNPESAKYAAATGAVGAGVGLAVPIIGVPLGAISGAMAGAGGALETGLTFAELLQEEVGGKLTKENIRAVLQDEEKLSRLRNKSLGRGMTIAAFEALSGGIAGKATKAVAKATGRKTLATLAGTGVEAVGGSLGEVGGRAVTGQEMDVAEIAFEGVTGTTTAPLSVGYGLYKAPKYYINKTKGGEKARVSGPQMAEFLKNATPEDIAAAEITIVNDDNMMNIAKEKRQNIVDEARIKKELKEAGVEDASIEKLVSLEKEKRKLQGNDTEAGKKRLSEVNKQINDFLEGVPLYEINNKQVTKEELQAFLADEENLKSLAEGTANISITNDQELTKEFTDKIKPIQDAIQEPSTEEVDVRKPARDGGEVGVRDTKEPEVTEEGEVEVQEQDVQQEKVITDEELTRYKPKDDEAELNDQTVLSKTFEKFKVETIAEPKVMDLGDTVVFEYNQADDSITRLTFKKKKNGELTTRGVKVSKNNLTSLEGTTTYNEAVQKIREQQQPKPPKKEEAISEVVAEEVEVMKGEEDLRGVKEGVFDMTSPTVLLKGAVGKIAPDGSKKTRHPNVKDPFATLEREIAEEYSRRDKDIEDVVEFDIPAGTKVEVVRIDQTGKTPTEVNKLEEDAINNSTADIVKLITRENKSFKGDFIHEQYIIKNPDLKKQKVSIQQKLKEQGIEPTFLAMSIEKGVSVKEAKKRALNNERAARPNATEAQIQKTIESDLNDYITEKYREDIVAKGQDVSKIFPLVEKYYKGEPEMVLELTKTITNIYDKNEIKEFFRDPRRLYKKYKGLRMRELTKYKPEIENIIQDLKESFPEADFFKDQDKYNNFREKHSKQENLEKTNLLKEIKKRVKVKFYRVKDKNSNYKKTKITKKAKEEIRDIKEKYSKDFEKMPVAELKNIVARLQEIEKIGKEERKEMAEQSKVKSNELQAQAAQVIEASENYFGTPLSLSTTTEIAKFKRDLKDKSVYGDGSVFIVKGRPTMVGEVRKMVKKGEDLGEVIQVLEKTTKNEEERKGFLARISDAIYPPSAKDFETLLYSLYGKGESGKNFFSKLLDTLDNAVAEEIVLNQSFLTNFKKIQKKYGRPKEMNKATGIMSEGRTPMDIKVGEAIYIYNFIKDPRMHDKLIQGGITYDVMNKIVDFMEKKNNYKKFAEELTTMYGMYRNDIEVVLDQEGYETFGDPTYSSYDDSVKTYYDENIKAKMSKDEALKDAFERADRTFNMLEKIYGGVDNIPVHIPYTPSRVESVTDEMDVQKLMDPKNDNNAITVLTGNLAAKKQGGELNWRGVYPADIANQYSNGVLHAVAFMNFFKESNSIFSKKNLERIRVLKGDDFVKELKASLGRMITNSRTYGMKPESYQMWFEKYIRGSQGLIMFLNTKSAMLQLVSSANYMAEMGPDYLRYANEIKRSDIKEITNSPYIKNRLEGTAGDVLMDELINGKGNLAQDMFSKTAKFGYSLTKGADATAIVLGGVPYYVAKRQMYIEKGMSPEQAKKKAMVDFIKISEKGQQSKMLSRLSSQQISSLPKTILAFANVPLQYNRIMYQAALDIKNGRGNPIKNVMKIGYYLTLQNFLFSALQQGLFALAFGEMEEEEERVYRNTINSTVNTLLRGLGVVGATLATAKDIALYLQYESEGKQADKVGYKIGEMVLGTAPGVGYKYSQIMRAFRNAKYAKEGDFETFSLPYTNIGIDVTAKERPFIEGASVLANIPLNRSMILYEQLADATNSNYEAWQRLGRIGGWNRWYLGMPAKWEEKKEIEKLKKHIRTTTPIRDLPPPGSLYK